MELNPPGILEPLGVQWVDVGSSKPKGGREWTQPGLVDALRSSMEVSEDEVKSLGLADLKSDDCVKVGDRYLRPKEQGFESILERWIERVYYPILVEVAQKKIAEEKAASPAKKARMMKRLKTLKKTFDAEIVEDADEYTINPNQSVRVE